jgi:hypothetical protein
MAAGGKGVGTKAFDTLGWRDNSWWQQRPAADVSSAQQWHAGGGKTTWTSCGKPGGGKANVTHGKQGPRPWGTTSPTSLPSDGEPHWFYYPQPAGWRIVMQDLPSDVTPDWVLYIIHKALYEQQSYLVPSKRDPFQLARPGPLRTNMCHSAGALRMYSFLHVQRIPLLGRPTW